MASSRRVAVSGTLTVKIKQWYVKQGEEIVKDAVLASYIPCGEQSPDAVVVERKLKSRFNGKVEKILAKQDEQVPPSKPVIVIKEDHCLHAIIMKDMCCECGEDLRKSINITGQFSDPVAAEVPMVHNIPELKVSFEEAERLARHDERQLLKARKLALVVDLDQTLIHTTHENIARDVPDIFHYQLPDHPFEYHTKLRPGAKKFLQTVSNFYELHIFTMGSRIYAHTIARHLDPDEKLFAHRIRSRDECMDSFSKSRDLRSLFPCGDHMVCIIDDREDIWDFAPNLVTVKPYRFFKGTGDINDPFTSKGNPGDVDANEQMQDSIQREEAVDVNRELKDENTTSSDADAGSSNEKNEKRLENDKNNAEENDRKSEKIDCAEPENNKEIVNSDIKSNGPDHPPDLDDYLFYLEEILERVHTSFYSTMDAIKAKGGLSRNDPDITRFCTPGTVSPDTRSIIPSLRQQVLKGANIVFTGVIPTNVPLKNSLVYRAAVTLGANVTDNIIVCNTDSNGNESTHTTHVIAARLGTEKAYRASRIKNVKLVGVDWLWCCAQRWEWVDERLFPVSSRLQGNGIGTPESSSRGTPISRERLKNNGTKKNGTLTKDAPGERAPTPDQILESVTPIIYNKDEFDEMDKEVEEYMLFDDNDDAQEDVLGSVSGSSGRSSANSTSSSSSTSSKNSTCSSPLEAIRQRKRELNEQLEAIRKKRKALLVDENVDNASSTDSSDNSNSNESDLQIGEMLEKQIDE